MRTLNELGKEIHQNAKDKGFFEKEKNIGEMLCLIHSEVSEALEADRKDKYFIHDPYTLNTIEGNVDFVRYYHEMAKGTFDEEMADIIIRVLDLCAFKGIDIEQHVIAKMRINSLREYKHGKKY